MGQQKPRSLKTDVSSDRKEKAASLAREEDELAAILGAIVRNARRNDSR
jgi:hypothetical protein